MPEHITGLFERWGPRFADREVLRFGDRSWTWSQWEERVRRNAARQRAAAIGPGDLASNAGDRRRMHRRHQGGRRLTERIAGHSDSPFRRIQTVVSHATGWHEPTISDDVVMRAIMGVPLGLAVDALFTDEQINVIDIADRLTTMLATGIREDGRRGGA